MKIKVKNIVLKAIFFKCFLIYIFVLKIPVKPVLAQTSLPDDCTILVDQISKGRVLNKYNKTHVYKIEDPNRSDDILRFTFDLSEIPKKYWEDYYTDSNNNKIPDVLEKSFIIWDVAQRLDVFNCVTDLSRFPGSINTNKMIFDLKARPGCLENKMVVGNEEFRVALAYKDNKTEYTVCKQTFTVDSEKYSQIIEEKPDASITIEADNGAYDITSKWKVTIKDLKIPSSLLTYTSVLLPVDIRVGPPGMAPGNILTISKQTESVLNVFGDSPIVDDPGNLKMMSIDDFIKASKTPDGIYFTLKSKNAGTYSLYILVTYDIIFASIIKEKSFTVNQRGAPTPTPTPTPIPQLTEAECDKQIADNNGELNSKICSQCKHVIHECSTFQPPPDLKEICDTLSSDVDKNGISERQRCEACTTGQRVGNAQPHFPEAPGAYTAIGCLPTDLSTFIGGYVFTIGLGIGGGIGFLLMLWGAFTILISSGNPERIKHGQEIIVSALAGLLLIIFSVLILRVIGVDILKIPGFT